MRAVNQRIWLGKLLLLLGILTDAVGLILGRGLEWSMGPAALLLEAGGLYLVFKARRAKQ